MDWWRWWWWFPKDLCDTTNSLNVQALSPSKGSSMWDWWYIRDLNYELLFHCLTKPHVYLFFRTEIRGMLRINDGVIQGCSGSKFQKLLSTLRWRIIDRQSAFISSCLHSAAGIEWLPSEFMGVGSILTKAYGFFSAKRHANNQYI